MPENLQEPHRRTIRIQGIDYAEPGAYFVTFVTHQRICILSEVLNETICLFQAGKVVLSIWNEIPKPYPHISLGEIVIMPNHVHAVLLLGENDGGSRQALPEIVRAWKSFSARRINMLRSGPGKDVWQRNYYEHIIRDNDDLNRIREYIRLNPVRWELDHENPENVVGRGSGDENEDSR